MKLSNTTKSALNTLILFDLSLSNTDTAGILLKSTSIGIWKVKVLFQLFTYPSFFRRRLILEGMP